MSKLVIGIAGGLGSGKTVVRQEFASLGINVLDTENMVSKIMQPNSDVIKKVIQHFGKEILDADDQLDNLKLRNVVFMHPPSLRWIEQLLRIHVLQEVKKRLPDTTSPYVVMRVPFLIESKSEYLVNRILFIETSKTLQIERIQKRDHLTRHETKVMLRTQMSRQEGLLKADDVIQNILSLSYLKQRVYELHQFYLSLAKQNETIQQKEDVLRHDNDDGV